MRDLDRAWAGPCLLLELSDPAGGSWTIGHATPEATIGVDAVDYMRTLAGRADQPQLDANGSPAAFEAAVAARVVF
jgi:murein endopeptidase